MNIHFKNEEQECSPIREQVLIGEGGQRRGDMVDVLYILA
jgi:hypothetical protein